jgi:hypothetical protein
MKEMILLRGIQLTHIQRYQGSTVKMVLSLHMPAFGARTFLVFITTIMDHKVYCTVVETVEQM